MVKIMSYRNRSRFLHITLLCSLLVTTQISCSKEEPEPEKTTALSESNTPAVAKTEEPPSDINVDTSHISAEQLAKYVQFDDEHLRNGFKIWAGTCENCHGYGTAGAPIPMESDAWKERIAKGKDILYQHAIEGFFGPGDTMMPERGGNLELTDEEVKSAVDYMVALATHYIEKN